METENPYVKLFTKAIDQGWIDRVFDIFRSKTTILVLGASGVGKSNLLLHLRSEIPQVIDAFNRTQFATREKIKLNGHSFEFIDLPGQVHHQSRRSPILRRAVTKNISGLINVVSYGYHEYAEGMEHAINRDGTVSVRYLEKHRDLEIQMLDEWVPLLGNKEIGKWLITVASKADLWWALQGNVMDYYRAGAYYNALNEAKELTPIVLSHSSVSHKFYGRIPVSGEFDDTARKNTRASLINTLIASLGNGER